jgi:Ca2+/Na+ antiporter
MAFALMLLSIVGFCVAWRSVGLLLVAGALAAMSWYVTEGPRGRHLPKWVSNILIIAVSLNVVVDLMQNRDDFLGVLGRFTVWLALIKLYERKTHRDYAQLLALSLLLMIVGCMHSSDLLFGVVLLAYAVLGLYVLLLYQLHASYEQTRIHRRALVPLDAPGSRFAPPLKPILGRAAGWHFRALVGGVGVIGFLLSALVFVIIPRNVGEGFFTRLQQPIGAGGFSKSMADKVDLSSTTRLSDSRKAVLTMTLRDSAGKSIQVDEPLLLRAGVLDVYDRDSDTWTTAQRRQGQRRVYETVSGAWRALADVPIDPALTYTQEITPLIRSDTIFSIYVPVAVQVPGYSVVFYDTVRQTLESTSQLSSYIVKAQPVPPESTLEQLGDNPDNTPSGRRRRAGDQSTHADPDPRHRPQVFWNPEIAALARTILRERGLPPHPVDSFEWWSWRRGAAKAFHEYLQGERFSYTLDLADVVNRGSSLHSDSVARFLLETRRGHCEYFAAALAALCHCVGIEARIVTGFVAYEYDFTEEQYIVRESNAHAWTEVRTGGHQWTTFDPTPARTLEEIHRAPDRTFADRLRWIYDRFEFKWNTSVVSFDSGSQERLAQSFDIGWSARLSGTLRSVREFMARVNRAFMLGSAGYVWMGIVGTALVIAIIALGKLMRRSRAIRRQAHLEHLKGSEYQRMLRQLGFYLDMLAVLARGRCAKPPWQPPRQFAAQLAESRPAAAALASELTDLFYEARYGSRRLSREQLKHADDLVGRLAESLRVRPLRPRTGPQHQD